MRRRLTSVRVQLNAKKKHSSLNRHAPMKLKVRAEIAKRQFVFPASGPSAPWHPIANADCDSARDSVQLTAEKERMLRANHTQEAAYATAAYGCSHSSHDTAMASSIERHGAEPVKGPTEACTYSLASLMDLLQQADPPQEWYDTALPLLLQVIIQDMATTDH